MSRNTWILVITLLVLIGILLGFSYFQGRSPTSKPPQTSAPAQSRPVDSTAATPPAVSTIRGMISSVSATSISVKSASQSKTFSFAQNLNVQKITSGSFGVDAVFASATVEDIRVGQEVIVTASIDGAAAVSILIVR